MEFKFVLCLLMAFYAIEHASASLDSLRNELQRAKDKVETIVSDLRRSRNDMYFSGNGRLLNLRGEKIQQLNNFVDSTQADLRKEADNAKAEGKNEEAVEKCYSTGYAALRSVSTAGYVGIGNCQNTGQRAVENLLVPLDNAQTTGSQLAAELDNVFPSCFSGNSFEMQFCIATKLGTINQSIRNYENSISSIKNNAQRGINSAVNEANTCSFKVVSDCRTKTTNTRLDFNKCMESV